MSEQHGSSTGGYWLAGWALALLRGGGWCADGVLFLVLLALLTAESGLVGDGLWLRCAAGGGGCCCGGSARETRTESASRERGDGKLCRR